MHLNNITIVVPTKNEQVNIHRFLASLPEWVKLIVVDDSSDTTPEIILHKRSKNTVVIKKHGNIAVARQAGVLASTTEWVLFTDADMIFDKKYFDNLRKLALPINCAGIVGSKCSRGKYKTYYALFNIWLRMIVNLGIPAATGSNMLVRKDAIIKAGGFDEQLTCNEDSLLMVQVKRAGFGVIFSGKLKVFETDHRRLDRGVFRKTVHSISRCILLLSSRFIPMMRKGDWGYWQDKEVTTVQSGIST